MHLVPVDLIRSRLRFVLVVWLTLSLRSELLEAQKPKLNMLFVIPANTREAIANRTAPAIVVALKTIERKGTLRDYDINWQLIDGQCSTTLTAKGFYKNWKHFNKKVHAIFGGYCEKVCQLMADIAESLNVPFLAVGCQSTDERNYLHYPTYLTLAYYAPSVFPVLLGLFEAYNWTRVAILATSDQAYMRQGILLKDAIEDRKWIAVLILITLDKTAENFNSEETSDEIMLVLGEIKKQGRVIFFLMDKTHAARILIVAQKNGMYNGEYAFIGFGLPHVQADSIGATENNWRMAKVGLLYFKKMTHYKGFESGSFIDLINSEDARGHPNFDWLALKTMSKTVEYYIHYAGDLYCAIRVYSYLLNYTLANMTSETSENVPERVASNGSRIMSSIFEKSRYATLTKDGLENTLDMLYFDETGQRAPVWALVNYREFGTEEVIYTYLPVGQECENQQIPRMNMIWPGKVTAAPLDKPKCGWDNEKCLDQHELILIYVSSALGAFALLGAIFAFYNARRMKKDVERKTLAEWQVKWSEVTVLGDNVIGRLSVHDARRSKTSVEAGSHADIRSSQRSTTSHSRLYTLVGTYKGKTVAIKKINRKSVDIYHPSIYSEIKQLFHINHENVNPFLGVCGEAPNVCVLMLYADRGSLQDVLADTKYDINWEFRLCLTTDIVKGMEYLHESPVGPHGHLTSSNCVVDSKWACRITDYGLKQFKQSYNPDISTFKWNTDLLWTAPEILVKPETDESRVHGTKEGDVYSFGIIVSELITKEMPFHSQLDTITPEDIVAKLKTEPQFRPVLRPPLGPVEAGWNNLAALCWHSKPEVRPNFKSILGKLKSIHGGKTPNLMQRVQRMLQDALEQKTTEIAIEKKRTETVIYGLLPKNIANEVINGRDVRPQRIESVTLCFCETTDLYESTKALTPHQMTELLKSLFHIYDGVIKKYNVVEVNCRGSKDSMMLGSGLPLSTKSHAEDICELSLDLISEALSFKTPLTSALNLNLKISVHSGPILTAVIWRMFPRYCVNGDAVQTIMAMHNASKAMRVRISEATYGHIRQSRGFTVEQGGKVTLKNATTMRSYWLTGKSGYRKPLPQAIKRRSSSLVGEA